MGLPPGPVVGIVPSHFGLDMRGISLLSGAAGVCEYQLKAVFLFDFADFVEWPSPALSGENAAFVPGVMGKDRFGSSLDEVVRGESVVRIRFRSRRNQHE